MSRNGKKRRPGMRTIISEIIGESGSGEKRYLISEFYRKCNFFSSLTRLDRNSGNFPIDF